MRIIVSGGAGFIGSHLTDTLIKKGHQVMILDDFSGSIKKFINAKARLFEVDIHDYPKVEKAFARFRPRVVYHLAAKIEIGGIFPDQKLYATDSMNIWHLSRLHKIKRLIFSSSAAIYGQEKKLPLKESSPRKPSSEYGRSKTNFELVLDSKHRRDKIKVVVLRFANVYGPRQGIGGEGGVVAIFCKKLLANQPLVINGTGEQTRDFIFVQDVVRSNLKALLSDKALAIYNVSTNRGTSINQIAKKLIKLSNKRVKILRRGRIKSEVLYSRLANRLIKRELGWRPEIGLDAGLKKTWEWFRSSDKW